MTSNEWALKSPEQYPYPPEPVRDSTLFALNCRPSLPVKMASSQLSPFRLLHCLLRQGPPSWLKPRQQLPSPGLLLHWRPFSHNLPLISETTGNMDPLRSRDNAHGGDLTSTLFGTLRHPRLTAESLAAILL